MANLIPPDAKKAIVREYWVRVLVVWLILAGCALIIVAVLKAPTLMLVQTQMNAFSGAYDDAKTQQDEFKAAERVLMDANDLSRLLTSTASGTSPLRIISLLDTIGGRDITISDFTINKTEGSVSTLDIRGVAATRLALSNFTRSIEADPLFAEANFPFSSLAKESDIPFSINIVPAE